MISDKHERRLAETACAVLGVVGIPCDVTDEATVQALSRPRSNASWARSTRW